MNKSVAVSAEQAEGLFEENLNFPDNRLLIDLCGEFDRNLAEIENTLSIQIVRRGNSLGVIGERSSVEKAAEVLGELYARLESGRSLEPGDLKAALRMESSSPRGPDGQLEMFKGKRIEIRTRKKTVEPRTDAQKAYTAALFDSELAFGIGPAGTGKTYIAVAVGVSMFIEGHVDKH